MLGGCSHLDAHRAIPLRRVGRWRWRLPIAVGGALHRDVLTRLRSADGSGGLLRRDGEGADVVHRAAQVRRELQPKHPTPHVRQDEDEDKEEDKEDMRKKRKQKKRNRRNSHRRKSKADGGQGLAPPTSSSPS